MNGIIATLVLIAAVLIMISINIFGDNGTMADAAKQKDRAHEISEQVTEYTAS